MMVFFRLMALLALLPALAVQAFETVRVAEGVYALVGELGQRSPANLGHNMTSGFIVGTESVVVIDSGASRQGAAAIDEAIRVVTDKPVQWVVNSGGQDHRWLGNDYFIEQGARVIASERGRQDMLERGHTQIEMSRRYLGKAYAGTEPAYPQVTFTGRHKLAFAGKRIELIETGGAHTPADILVWLPDQRILFTGDTVFVQRLLGVMPNTGLNWIKSLEYIRDRLEPEIIVPGHGRVTDLEEALRDSYDYLVMLRDSATASFEAGAFDPVEAIEGLDQTRFSYLHNYDDLSFRSRNALNMSSEIFEGQ